MIEVTDLYVATPVCPHCGTRQGDRWDASVGAQMDYSWRGWADGDTAALVCERCDRSFGIVARTHVTFLCEKLP